MSPEISGKVPRREGISHLERGGQTIEFEGVKIQWSKGEWEFNHPELGIVIKPTYSLLNPRHWEEIACLLSEGKTAAGMMMGVYGVFKELKRKDVESADALFRDVKQRPPSQNFVALVHPKDMDSFIDGSRLQEPFKTLLNTRGGRLALYAGPQHIILPVKKGNVHPALVRQEDQTIACFWVPSHFGFEGLVRKTRRRFIERFIGGGLLGGGSLNIHGRDPYYDKDSLREAMAQQREWLEEIDFIIFDDIAEAGDIGRSHTMVRYIDEQPEVIRVGSLSLERVRKATGHDIVLARELRHASSKTPYSPDNDKLVEARVEEVLQRIQRFNLFLQGLSVRK